MKFLLFKAKDIEEAYQQNKASAPERLTQEELLSLFKKAEEYIPQRVQYYAPLIWCDSLKHYNPQSENKMGELF